jgi:hypothetical protein
MQIFTKLVLWFAKLLRLRFWQKRVDEKVKKILDEAGEQIAIEIGNRSTRAILKAAQDAGVHEAPKEELICVKGNVSIDNIVVRIPIPKGLLFDSAVSEFTRRGIARRYLNGDLRIKANGLFTVKANGREVHVEMLELPPLKENE